jgi:hypothetical protein
MRLPGRARKSRGSICRRSDLASRVRGARLQLSPPACGESGPDQVRGEGGEGRVSSRPLRFSLRSKHLPRKRERTSQTHLMVRRFSQRSLEPRSRLECSFEARCREHLRMRWEGMRGGKQSPQTPRPAYTFVTLRLDRRVSRDPPNKSEDDGCVAYFMMSCPASSGSGIPVHQLLELGPPPSSTRMFPRKRRVNPVLLSIQSSQTTRSRV